MKFVCVSRLTRTRARCCVSHNLVLGIQVVTSHTINVPVEGRKSTLKFMSVLYVFVSVFGVGVWLCFSVCVVLFLFRCVPFVWGHPTVNSAHCTPTPRRETRTREQRNTTDAKEAYVCTYVLRDSMVGRYITLSSPYLFRSFVQLGLLLTVRLWCRPTARSQNGAKETKKRPDRNKQTNNTQSTKLHQHSESLSSHQQVSSSIHRCCVC